MSLHSREIILHLALALVSASIVLALASIIHAGLDDVISSIQAGAPNHPEQLKDAVRAVINRPSLSDLPIGLVSATFYLMLKSLTYWAQGRLEEIELNLEQVAKR